MEIQFGWYYLCDIKNKKDMSSYLVTVFGDYQKDEVVGKVSSSILPIVESDELKFYRSEHSVIYHFTTELNFEELSVFLRETLDQIADVVIISPAETSIILSNDEFHDHLSEFVGNSESTNASIDIVKVYQGLEQLKQEMMDIEDDEEDEIKLIKERAQVKQPSLDDLLDKITDKGYDSLTAKEKKLLIKLSK